MTKCFSEGLRCFSLTLSFLENEDAINFVSSVRRITKCQVSEGLRCFNLTRSFLENEEPIYFVSLAYDEVF